MKIQPSHSYIQVEEVELKPYTKLALGDSYKEYVVMKIIAQGDGEKDARMIAKNGDMILVSSHHLIKMKLVDGSEFTFTKNSSIIAIVKDLKS